MLVLGGRVKIHCQAEGETMFYHVCSRAQLSHYQHMPVWWALEPLIYFGYSLAVFEWNYWLIIPQFSVATVKKTVKKLNRNTYTLYIVNCVYCCLIPITRHRLNGVKWGQGVEKEEDKAYLKPHLLPGVLQSFLPGKFAFPSKSLHPWDVLEMKASSCQTCKIASQAGRAPGRGHPIHQTHWLLKGRSLRIVKMMNPNGWQHPGYRS